MWPQTLCSNIVSTYAKYRRFSVQGGNVAHKAAFIVRGYPSKGPANPFALPTHKPIMMLYDRPGVLSYATYENVKTNMALVGLSTKLM